MNNDPCYQWFAVGVNEAYKAASKGESLVALLRHYSAEKDSLFAETAAHGIVNTSVMIASSAASSNRCSFSAPADWLNCDKNIVIIRLNREVNSGNEERKLKTMLSAAMAADECISRGFVSVTQTTVRQVEDNGLKPVRVEVVSLPTRETTTEIERDSVGNIKQTTQIERDAA